MGTGGSGGWKPGPYLGIGENRFVIGVRLVCLLLLLLCVVLLLRRSPLAGRRLLLGGRRRRRRSRLRHRGGEPSGAATLLLGLVWLLESAQGSSRAHTEHWLQTPRLLKSQAPWLAAGNSSVCSECLRQDREPPRPQ